MNTVYKSILKKGAVLIFVSAFVGLVYASQWHNTVHLTRFIPNGFLAVDTPPPDTASFIDTRSAPAEPAKPQNNVNPNDTGLGPVVNPPANNNTNPNNPAPNNQVPGNNVTPNNPNLPPPDNAANPAPPNQNPPSNTNNPANQNNNNATPPIPTQSVKEVKKDDSVRQKALAADTANRLHYPISKEGEGHKSSFDFTDPLKKDVQLDSGMNYYIIKHKAGNSTVGDSEVKSFKQYQAEKNKQWMQDYFKKRSEAQVNTQKGGLLPKLNLQTGTPLDDLAKLVKIEPNGSATLIFSEDFSRVQNPTYSLNEQRNAQFKFDQKIQVSVTASIGDRIKMNFRYDTQASFDFENQKKISYQGKEDDILQSIDAGDVSFPVSGTLITGSQSLFGVKTKLKFGKLDVSAIFAQEKSDQKSITLQGGAQTNNFKITCDNYDANRNYFLAQYFVNHYDQYNAQWPALSNIQITKVELWVTNTGASVTNTRTIAAFLDLGEGQPYNKSFIRSNNLNPAALPGNAANTLYQTLKRDSSQYRVSNNIASSLNSNGGSNFVSTRDYYVLQNARELQPNEYTLNAKLGYISLNQQLNPSDLLAVAFQYTIDGKTYQVGEFAEDVPPNPTTPNVLFLKMLKSVVIDSHVPDWNLMMKNIYSLGTYQISPTNFKFQVVYDDTKTGAYLNYLPEPQIPGMDGTPLIRLLGMDKVNSENQPKPDGQFDYIEGVTVISAQGKIIFPVLEPFGKDMKKLFGNDTTLAANYVYQLLYDSTHTFAVQDQTHNKFFLEGSFQGTAGNVIMLNSVNVPQGSVKVTANGVPLVEGTDYTVDYNQGRVTIINQSVLNSGAVINVTSESNSLFSIQQKTLMGTHLDYHFSKKFTLGSTFLYLNERPLTTKVNIGEEPVSNAIWGFDGHYNSDSKFLTDMVNKIPLIQTKEKSTFTAEGEFAEIIPGHPAVLNQPGQTGGTSYIDDFEGSIVPYDLRLGGNWFLASCPQGQPTRFPEGGKVNDLSYGYRRAKTAWYVIDNTMFENISGVTPANILGNNALLSDPAQRMVQETEVFPNEQIAAGTPDICQTFDVYYNPKQRGPYNYSTTGFDANGTFTNPSENWGGLQRSLPITDFLDANIQYVELWLMDPYTNPSAAMPVLGTGTMEIDLGTISEDVLHDDRESWENGLTCDGSAEDVTEWGRVPNGLHITTAFDNDPTTRPCQDVGYDGLPDDSERIRFAPFLNYVKNHLTTAAFASLYNDPSGDDFLWFKDGSYNNANANIVQRYTQINGVEGNTPVNVGGATGGYGSLNPDDEDINHDFNVETSEAYYEYEVKIDPLDLAVGRNYVTDEQSTVVTLPNGTQQTAKWYQFKIPVDQYTRAIGSIQDFTSIRFMRMYLTGFTDPMLLRFARLQLVRGDWRKYLYSLNAAGDPLPTDTAQENLDVSAISIQTDGQRPGIRYVIPPGIQRQIDYSTPSLIQENEQSLDLKICGLKDGESRAVYKNVTLDLRQYKTLEMFVHCEANNKSMLKDGDLHLFIRFGVDYTANYYELDMPLAVTQPSATGNVDLTWPTANQIQLAVQQWVDMKTNRNLANGSLAVPYTVGATGTSGELTVLGNPDLGNIRTIMIGLRHPKGDDKGPTPCAEVWVDELRMAGFNEKGGWAATTRVMTKLADFGRVELSASRQTIGFGGIDQSLQQRNTQDMTNIGVISSLNLDKFFPKKYGVKIPMFFSYSQQLNTPEYNPLSPDQQLATLTSVYKNNVAKQDSVIQACEDFTARKSLNFTGVHKERTSGTGKKTHIYDIENFNATYIYSEIDRHNITSIYNNQITYSAQLTYRYDFKPKSWDPFKTLSSKYLKLLHDMNFYYLPQNFTMVGKIDRNIQEQLYRNTADYQTINLPMYDKTFTFTRKYDLRYNFSNGLRLTYSATSLSLINEPNGLIDSAYKRQIIWHNILSGGVPSNFVQNTALDYDIPISKLPFLDWTTLHANYTANYQWTAAPPIAAYLGNVVQNSQIITGTGQLNFANLYGKSKYLKNIMSGVGNSSVDEKDKKDTSKTKILQKNIRGANIKPDIPSLAPNHLTSEETLLGLLMSIRTVQFTYTLTNGTALPGFLPTPQHFGENFASQAPGFPFIFGSQADIREKAARSGWITNDTNLSQQYITNHRESLIGSASLEPVKDLKIKVDFTRTQTSTFTETYRYIDTISAHGGVYSGFAHLSPVETGNFTISVISFVSSFKPNGSNNSNVVFNNFLNDRLPIAQALARSTPGEPTRIDSAGFPVGYSRTHQDVLIPAFLQAYTGMKVGTNEFPQIPAPNWSITYTGLSNYPAFKSIAKQITISSGYHSTYTVSSYTSNLYYNPAKPTFDTTYSNSTNYYSKYLMQGVTISERFDPLIGIDITLKSNWTGAFSFAKERQESLTFIDQRITENKTNKVTLGVGYITNRLYLPFTRGRNKRYLKNEFKFRFDVQVNQNEQVVRILDQNTADATGGQLMISILPNITYTLNKSLTLNIFVKRNMTTPYTSNQFPTSLTSVGFSLKYILTP